MSNLVVVPFAHCLNCDSGREEVIKGIHELSAKVPESVSALVKRAACYFDENPLFEANMFLSQIDMDRAVWLACLFDAALNNGFLLVEEWADEAMMGFASAIYVAAGFDPEEDNPLLAAALNSLSAIKN